MQIANGIWRIVKPPSDGRLLIAGLCALLLALRSFAEAQQPAKIPRIGYLALPAKPSARDEAFAKQLRDLGWVDGQNIVIEYRWAEISLKISPRLLMSLSP
jgi:hypothetical protein